VLYHAAGLWIVPWASVSVPGKWQAGNGEVSTSSDFVATLRSSKLGFRPGPHGCSTSTFFLNLCRTRRIGSTRSESLVTTTAVSYPSSKASTKR
jgi:hypothetical protein